MLKQFLFKILMAMLIRDQNRPKRDARVGMLPPKLAQIMINLANPEAGSLDTRPVLRNWSNFTRSIIDGL